MTTAEFCNKEIKTNPCSWRDHRHNALVLRQMKELLCELDPPDPAPTFDIIVVSINENLESGNAVTLPDIVAQNKIIFVEIDGIKIDHVSIAGAGFISWTIATNIITFSEILNFVNIKVAYLKNISL